MKKLNLLKSLFLLCALIVGSSSVWASSVFEPVTSTTQLVAGQKYLIVNRYKTKAMPSPEWYSLGDYGGKVYNSEEITASGDIDDFATLCITDAKDSHVLTLGGSAGHWTLYDATESKYLALTKDANEIQQANDATANTAEWTITIDASNLVTIKNVGFTTNNRQIEGNQGSSRFACYKAQQSGNATYLFVEKTVPATITAAEYATFYTPAALDFSATGITAYTVTVGATSASLNEITSGKVPANTPVLLYKAGADGTAINVPVIASAEAVGANDLHVSNGGEPGANAYVLANKTHGVGFYKWNGGSLTSGKVYLQAATPAHEFIGFDGETTGINAIDNGQLTIDNSVYDLMGRKVVQPTKGLYIVNGKKVIIK